MISELSNTSLSSGNSGQTDGSCLCGAVKFSISGPPLMKLLCHCVSCKKISGSLFQANNFYSISQLTISPLTDPNAIKTYVDKSPESGKGVHRTFCAVWLEAVEYDARTLGQRRRDGWVVEFE
ncbi:hypothetical protein ACEPPN_002200 [Leptodophora sp. 'Broadleaf-Isolate-01']